MMFSYLERLQNHLVDMYKNGRLELQEFNSLMDFIYRINEKIVTQSVSIELMKSALEKMLDLDIL